MGRRGQDGEARPCSRERQRGERERERENESWREAGRKEMTHARECERASEQNRFETNRRNCDSVSVPARMAFTSPRVFQCPL